MNVNVGTKPLVRQMSSLVLTRLKSKMRVRPCSCSGWVGDARAAGGLCSASSSLSSMRRSRPHAHYHYCRRPLTGTSHHIVGISSSSSSGREGPVSYVRAEPAGARSPQKPSGHPSDATNAATDVWGTSKKLYEEAGGIAGGGRVRQHINPLKSELQQPTRAPKWLEIYEDCTLPLEVDVGCGSGRYILARAKKCAGRANFFGMDIRGKLIERSNKWASILGITNVYYLSTNATISLESVLKDYPGPISFVSIQYPDPHFKKKHHKRRIVQDEFISQLSDVIDPKGGRVFLQSDVHEVIVDMRKRFEQRTDCFRLATAEEVLELAKENDVFSSEEEGSEGESLHAEKVYNEEGWIRFNPTGIPTEREVHASAEGGDVYRCIFRKK